MNQREKSWGLLKWIRLFANWEMWMKQTFSNPNTLLYTVAKWHLKPIP